MYLLTAVLVYGLVYFVVKSYLDSPGPSKWKPYKGCECLHCGQKTLIRRFLVSNNPYTAQFYCTRCEETVDWLVKR